MPRVLFLVTPENKPPGKACATKLMLLTFSPIFSNIISCLFFHISSKITVIRIINLKCLIKNLKVKCTNFVLEIYLLAIN